MRGLIPVIQKTASSESAQTVFNFFKPVVVGIGAGWIYGRAFSARASKDPNSPHYNTVYNALFLGVLKTLLAHRLPTSFLVGVATVQLNQKGYDYD